MLHSISSEKSDVDGEGGTNSYFRQRIDKFWTLLSKPETSRRTHTVLTCLTIILVGSLKRATSVFTWRTPTLPNSQGGCMPTAHALHQISPRSGLVRYISINQSINQFYYLSDTHENAQPCFMTCESL